VSHYEGLEDLRLALSRAVNPRARTDFVPPSSGDAVAASWSHSLNCFAAGSMCLALPRVLLTVWNSRGLGFCCC
jgi:uncharacterized protein (DUF2236 family)